MDIQYRRDDGNPRDGVRIQFERIDDNSEKLHGSVVGVVPGSISHDNLIRLVSEARVGMADLLQRWCDSPIVLWCDQTLCPTRSCKMIDLFRRLFCFLGFHDFRVVEVTMGFGPSGTEEKMKCRRCGHFITRRQRDS